MTAQGVETDTQIGEGLGQPASTFHAHGAPLLAEVDGFLGGLAGLLQSTESSQPVSQVIEDDIEIWLRWGGRSADQPPAQLGRFLGDLESLRRPPQIAEHDSEIVKGDGKPGLEFLGSLLGQLAIARYGILHVLQGFLQPAKSSQPKTEIQCQTRDLGLLLEVGVLPDFSAEIEHLLGRFGSDFAQRRGALISALVADLEDAIRQLKAATELDVIRQHTPDRIARLHRYVKRDGCKLLQASPKSFFESGDLIQPATGQP